MKIGQIQLHASWELAGKPVKAFIAPSDPTADRGSDRTSYLVNGLAFPRGTNPRFPDSFTDGTPYTIFFAEAYSRAVDLFPGRDPTKPAMVDRRWWDDPVWVPLSPTGVAEPRPDQKVGDALFSVPGFQVAPGTQAASALLPQGFSEAGINVGMGDGSVRMLNLRCSTATFYAACTPDGGDVTGTDW